VRIDHQRRQWLVVLRGRHRAPGACHRDLSLAITPPSSVLCRHGNTGSINTRHVEADSSRSATSWITSSPRMRPLNG
jgi:hypothetical protein